MFFVIRRSKESGGSLSYGKSEWEILFLKVWSNFVEKINAIGQYLVVESFVWKKNIWCASVRFRARAPLNAAAEFIFLM